MAAVIEQEDGFWKEVLDAFFDDFLALLFPEAHAGIDWQAGVRPRDKELTKLLPDNRTGARFVDKLVEVRGRGGDLALVMVHIEVQSHPDGDFARRMFTYYYRLFDRYGPDVVSLALLADADTAWRPRAFTTELWGCGLQFVFPTAKLLDFRDRKDELNASYSPFALLVLAILKAQDTAAGGERAIAERSHWKLDALRSLYERGYSRTHMRHLFRFLDWAVRLPENIDDQLHVELAKSEEGKKMTYITSFERYGIRKGMEQGRLNNARESVIDVLEVRFGAVHASIRDAVHEINDLSVCKQLLQEAIRATSLDEFSTQMNCLGAP